MAANKAIIIGGGPAGLTAALELLEKTDIKPLVLEMTGSVGGISKTVNFKGNRIDIGGHRFFTKSDRIMDYWKRLMPVQGAPSKDDKILNRKVPLSTDPSAPDPDEKDNVFLVRQRISRIFFLRKFFDYPISLRLTTLLNLGLVRTIKIGVSYVYIRLFPIKVEKSLEDFIINRFGKELYSTFFRDYTEKVWGVPCEKIKPEWGAQRIKGLSISKAVAHAVKSMFAKDSSIEQKKTETSLIGQFLYPKHGPGQMWEEMAKKIVEKGGEIRLNSKVVGIDYENGRIKSVKTENNGSGAAEVIEGDYLISTMPVRDLIHGFGGQAPSAAKEVADGLLYRDFITVGLLLNKMKIHNETKFGSVNNIIPDNWIYIQEADVKVGRLQIFNNWSPYMVEDDTKVWIGLEYFCNEGDSLWSMDDARLIELAKDEMDKMGVIDKQEALDATVIRVPKTYPAYFGAYDRFDEIRNFVDTIPNLYLIGRNGMHRYNNMDHSMLTAMLAVENIKNGIDTKENIWSVNVEGEYHETK